MKKCIFCKNQLVNKQKFFCNLICNREYKKRYKDLFVKNCLSCKLPLSKYKQFYCSDKCARCPRCKVCNRKLPIENPHWKKCDRPECNKPKMKKYKATKHSLKEFSWACDCYDGLGFIKTPEEYCCFACLAINPNFKKYETIYKKRIL